MSQLGLYWLLLNEVPGPPSEDRSGASSWWRGLARRRGADYELRLRDAPFGFSIERVETPGQFTASRFEADRTETVDPLCDYNTAAVTGRWRAPAHRDARSDGLDITSFHTWSPGASTEGKGRRWKAMRHGSQRPTSSRGAPGPPLPMSDRDVIERERAVRRAGKIAARRRPTRRRTEAGVPRHDEPRDPHAHERRARHARAAVAHASSTPSSAPRSRSCASRANRCCASSTTSSTSPRSRRASSSSRPEPTSIGAVARAGREHLLAATRAARACSSATARRRIAAAVHGRSAAAAADPQQPVSNAIKFTDAGRGRDRARSCVERRQGADVVRFTVRTPASASPRTEREHLFSPSPRSAPTPRGASAAPAWAFPSAAAWRS